MDSLEQRIKSLSQTLGVKGPEESQRKSYSELREQYDKDANADVAQAQTKSKIARINQIHGDSDLNPKWTFENLSIVEQSEQEVFGIAQSFIAAHSDLHWRRESAHLMLFYGDYGRGKSHIAGAIAHELIKEYEVTVLYRQLSSLLQMRNYSFDNKAEDMPGMKFRELESLLQTVDLLIIDEVAVNESRLSMNAQSWLGNLLRLRLAEKKNCIMITNHSLDSLQQAIGKYCYESIREYDTYLIKFSGGSKRKQIVDIDEGLTNQEGYKPSTLTKETTTRVLVALLLIHWWIRINFKLLF